MRLRRLRSVKNCVDFALRKTFSAKVHTFYVHLRQSGLNACPKRLRGTFHHPCNMLATDFFNVNALPSLVPGLNLIAIYLARQRPTPIAAKREMTYSWDVTKYVASRNKMQIQTLYGSLRTTLSAYAFSSKSDCLSFVAILLYFNSGRTDVSQ